MGVERDAYLSLSRETFAVAFATLVLVALPWNPFAVAAEISAFKTADGLTVYIGVMPAEIVKGHLGSRHKCNTARVLLRWDNVMASSALRSVLISTACMQGVDLADKLRLRWQRSR